MFRIGEFSRLSMVPVSALRYYDTIGVLAPAVVDDATGYRYYAAAQLPMLNRILALKDLGLSLDEIRGVLAEHLCAAELRGMLVLKRTEIARRVSEDQAWLARVEGRLRLIEKEGAMPDHEVIVKKLEPLRGLAVREVVPSTQSIGELIGDALGGVFGAGLQLTAGPVAIYHDIEFDPEHIDVEVVCPVGGYEGEPLPTPGGRKLAMETVAGGLAAVVVHVGPYEELAGAYQAIGAWIEDHGYRFAGPAQETYLTGPDEPGPPVTEIRVPIGTT
jgi:DNA-binding transcriptional MerR regulator